MKQKMAALEKYLADTVKLPTEHFSVSVEEGNASCLYEQWGEYDQLINESGETTGFVETGVKDNFQMLLKYRLSIDITHYGGDPATLLALLSHWVRTHCRGLSPLRFDGPQRNNDRTVDLWIDIDIEETWFNRDGKLVTCG